MCRHAAYWGPPVAISEVVVDVAHSLLTQCVEAREMLWGRDNLDGWGYGWFEPDRAEAKRYRTAVSMTEDRDGVEALRRVRSDRFVVHVRQKSPGATTQEQASAPFRQDGWLFTHNGIVDHFNEGGREMLLDRVTPARRGEIEGDADSEVLFALVLDRLAAGEPAAEAVRVVADVARELGGRYNVLLMSADELVATRWGNTLYWCETDAVTVSSEPLDDTPWLALDEGSILTIDAAGVGKETW